MCNPSSECHCSQTLCQACCALLKTLRPLYGSQWCLIDALKYTNKRSPAKGRGLEEARVGDKAGCSILNPLVFPYSAGPTSFTEIPADHRSGESPARQNDLVCVRAVAVPGSSDCGAACSLHVVLVHSLAGNGSACLLFPSLQSRFWVYGKVSVLKQEQSTAF